MSGKLLQFAGNPHDESMRLLPWLLNGTLDADERAFVEGHLQECARCRSELETLRGVQAACERTDDDSPPPPAFARLRARIDASEPAAASFWRARLSALAGGWRRAPGWLRGLAWAQAALLLAVVAAWSLRGTPAASQPAYRTLGSGTAAGVALPGEARLLLVFAPETDQGSTRQLLRATGARIVDGPSDAGAYVIAVDARRAAAARDALRAADGVQLVEVLDAGTPQ
jgi:anti-sigma factor RsiW